MTPVVAKAPPSTGVSAGVTHLFGLSWFEFTSPDAGINYRMGAILRFDGSAEIGLHKIAGAGCRTEPVTPIDGRGWWCESYEFVTGFHEDVPAEGIQRVDVATWRVAAQVNGVSIDVYFKPSTRGRGGAGTGTSIGCDGRIGGEVPTLTGIPQEPSGHMWGSTIGEFWVAQYGARPGACTPVEYP
jgi:hypothetical protein